MKRFRPQQCLAKAARLSATLPVLITIFFTWTASVAYSAPSSNYTERVRHAMIELDSLQSSEPAEREQATEAIFAKVASLLPPNESVETSGGIIKVDNRWLHESLNSYRKLGSNDPARTAFLGRIVEQLEALNESLGSTSLNSSQTQSKDEAKSRLAGILARPEYLNEEASEDALSRVLRRLRQWLSDLVPRPKPLSTASGLLITRIAEVIIAVLSLGLLAFLIAKLWPYFARRSGRRRLVDGAGARIVLGERIREDQSSADLLSEAEALARAGDIRGAIRKAYIALLCEMGDRKLISLAPHKTNRDYLKAVKDRPLFGAVLPLTNTFEAHWYGFFPASETDWQSFKSLFEQARSQMPA